MYSLILHGRRLVQLQKFCNLRVSVQNLFAFSNSFSSATSAADVSPQDGRKGRNFTVSSYLVDSLGLTTKVAESISRKVSFKDKGNPDAVLDLLRSHGFTASQISTIITDYPQVLIADAQISLAPKLQFLQARGASASELTDILSKVPKILGIKKDKAFSRYYDFVKEIVEADKSSNYKKLCPSSLPQGSAQENKIRNISVLRELRMPQKLLFSMLTSDVQFVCGKERFEESLKKVVEMGFDPTTPKFVKALRKLYALSDETIKGKVEVYRRLGIAVDDVWAIFKKWPDSLSHSEKKITQTFETLKQCGLHEDEILSVLEKFPQIISYSEQKMETSIETLLGLGFSKGDLTMIFKCTPQCFGYSAEKLKKKTEFLVKKMHWPLKALVSNPSVFSYSLERTVLRCNVIKALMSKGLLGTELPPMGSVLICTDEVFLKRYVRKLDEKEIVPELMAIFTGDIAS